MAVGYRARLKPAPRADAHDMLAGMSTATRAFAATALTAATGRRRYNVIAVGATALALLCGRPDSASAMDPECLADATKLAIQIGASIDRQASVVFMRHTAAEEMTFACGDGLPTDLLIAWDGLAPPPNTVQLIASAGAFLTGVSVVRIKTELANCIAAALKPAAGEFAEFHGVKIECHAFTRAGGGGSVTIYSKQVRP
jgi:hypothetical protein